MSVLDHPVTSCNPAASAPMHEYARECTVSAECEFSLTHLNTLTISPNPATPPPPRRFHVVSMSLSVAFGRFHVALHLQFPPR
jgi:hypothetical protein